MKGFIWGVLLTLIAIAGIGLFTLETGDVSTRADVAPSKLETAVMGHAMSTSIEHHAPKAVDPLMPTPANVEAGAEIYRAHCAACHGDMVHPRSPLADTLNPPPPQFMTDPADMPDNENYFIVQHGIRWTGMPGWEKELSDQQIWEVVTFLDNMNNSNLPPQVRQIFSGSLPATFGTIGEAAPASAAPQEKSAAATRPAKPAASRAHPHK